MPETVVWPAAWLVGWTKELLTAVAFPGVRISEAPLSCGNTDAFPKLRASSSVATFCCSEVALFEPGRRYLVGGFVADDSARHSEAVRASALLRERAYAYCGVRPEEARKAGRVVFLSRDAVTNSGGEAFLASMSAFARLLHEKDGVRLETRWTRAGLGLCGQLRKFTGVDVVVTAHGQQITNSMFMPAGSLLIEVVPDSYYPNDGPSMFALQNRDAEFQHVVVSSSGTRADMPFDSSKVHELVTAHVRHV